LATADVTLGVRVANHRLKTAAPDSGSAEGSGMRHWWDQWR